MTIPFPHLLEPRVIAQVLSDVDAQIAALNKAIANNGGTVFKYLEDTWGEMIKN